MIDLAAASAPSIDRDTRDIQRSALWGLAGHGLRAAHPVLLALATRRYGAASWGIYVAGQAAAYIALRLCLMGYDRSLLYWVPRSLDERGCVVGLRPMFLRVGLLSLLVAVILSLFGGAWVARVWEVDRVEALLTPMFATLPLLALTELCSTGLIGMRHLRTQTVVRDSVIPLAFVVLAVVFDALGVGREGLGYAYFASYFLGVGLTAHAFYTHFRPVMPAKESWFAMPGAWQNYARPLWASEVMQTLIQRIDVVILALFLSPALLGVYGIAMQFGNTVRSLRTAFDSMFTAIVAELSGGGRRRIDRRFDEGFSYATALVAMAQTSVVAVFLCLSPWILRLFGEEFTRGTRAVAIVSLAWMLNGLMGLAGQAVNGFGGSRATLFAALLALVIELVGLLTLPRIWGLEGGCFAVGIAFVAQGAIHLVQMRAIVGRWSYTRRLRALVARAGIAFALMASVAAAVPASVPLLAARSLALIAFLAVFLSGARSMTRAASA